MDQCHITPAPTPICGAQHHQSAYVCIGSDEAIDHETLVFVKPRKVAHPGREHERSVRVFKKGIVVVADPRVGVPRSIGRKRPAVDHRRFPAAAAIGRATHEQGLPVTALIGKPQLSVAADAKSKRVLGWDCGPGLASVGALRQPEALGVDEDRSVGMADDTEHPPTQSRAGWNYLHRVF